MRKTKDKILQTALMLFNKNGVVNVTLRQIALDMNISQGNLNYHFKLKEDIIEALYFQLVAEMDDQINDMTEVNSELESLYNISLRSMNIMYDYRFILIDFSHLMNEHKKIRQHYSNLIQMRKDQFQYIFKSLTDSSILKAEELDDEYGRLYQRMNILGDNWINYYCTFDQKNNVKYYFDLLFEMIYPYLTATGKEEYKRIVGIQ